MSFDKCVELCKYYHIQEITEFLSKYAFHSTLLIGKLLSDLLTAHQPVGLHIRGAWSLPLASPTWLWTTTSAVQALTPVFLLHGNRGRLSTHVEIRWTLLLLWPPPAVTHRFWVTVSIPVILSSAASGSPKNTNYWSIAPTCLAMAYTCPG